MLLPVVLGPDLFNYGARQIQLMTAELCSGMLCNDHWQNCSRGGLSDIYKHLRGSLELIQIRL